MLHDVSLGDGRCNDALFVSRFFQRAKVHIIFIAAKKNNAKNYKKDGCERGLSHNRL